MALASSTLFLSSCDGNNEPTPTPEGSFTVTPEALEIAGSGGTKTFEVKTTEAWTVESSETWCKIDKTQGTGDGTVTVSITEKNPKTDAPRLATITVKSAAETATIAVTQLASSVAPRDDRGRLMALYNATGGPSWKNNTNWGTDEHISTWYGVVVDVADPDRIVGLNLNENGLDGTLPDEICDIKALTILNLQLNKLKGEIPANIGNLTNMLTLSLFDNEFTGSIPKSIGKLTAMTYFSVWTNKMSGPIPTEIGDCTMLKDLWLYGNKFNGQIPASIGNLQYLEQLYIRDNDFSGTIPKELGNCVSLRDCEIGINPQLTGAIPKELGNLRNLEYLYLKECNLTGEIPAELFPVGSKLARLNLRTNNLTGSIPASISNAPLTEMFAYENKLSGTVPQSLVNKVNADKSKFTLTPQQSGYTFDNLPN